MAKRLDHLLRHLASDIDRPQLLSAPVAAGHALPASGATVCVTGAAGYVGSWLVRLCLERGHAVRACVRNVHDDRKARFLKEMPEFKTGRLTLHSADMSQAGAYDMIFDGVHTVFHTAEVFMSFSPGRDRKKAAKDFGQKVSLKSMHGNAVQSSEYLVDSINKCPSVKCLIYTASVASMMHAMTDDFLERPALDEAVEPDPAIAGFESYGITKRQTEQFLADVAASSNGRWTVLAANPSDIIGPVLSPHQAFETWQGKITGIGQGIPCPQDWAGRPWFVVDVRDVAEAEIRLAESVHVESGSRFLLSSGDKIDPENIGRRVMELFPDYDCATTVTKGTGAKTLERSDPIWLRVHLRNDRIANAVGMKFRKWDDTLRATVESLVSVGGIQPKLK